MSEKISEEQIKENNPIEEIDINIDESNKVDKEDKVD